MTHDCLPHQALNSSINAILKIKTLPGGSRAHSHYVDGLVCRLKLAHKCMRTELAWPRILLLKPSLEHDMGAGVTSLEANMRQEDEHMEMVVHEMAKLRVDLLLVGGSVCFTAKEKLLKRGIALAVGVKPQVLERVSRCTNTPVLLSPAQVAGATPGTCGRWRVENVTITVPPAAVPYAPPSTRLQLGGLDSLTMAFGMPGVGGAACAPTSALVPAGPGAVPGGHTASAATKRVTLMYFERCPPELLATVVLRGGEPTEMKVLKQMLSASAYVAADLWAEAAYLFEMGGTTSLPSPNALNTTPIALVGAAVSTVASARDSSLHGVALSPVARLIGDGASPPSAVSSAVSSVPSLPNLETNLAANGLIRPSDAPHAPSAPPAAAPAAALAGAASGARPVSPAAPGTGAWTHSRLLDRPRGTVALGQPRTEISRAEISVEEVLGAPSGHKGGGPPPGWGPTLQDTADAIASFLGAEGNAASTAAEPDTALEVSASGAGGAALVMAAPVAASTLAAPTAPLGIIQSGLQQLLGVQPAAAAPAPPPMSFPTVGTRPNDDPMLSGSGSAAFMLGVAQFSENHAAKKESEEYFLSAALDVTEGDHPLSLGGGSRDGFIHRRGSRDLFLHSAADAGAAAPDPEPGAMAAVLCPMCEEQPADRLWHEEARTLRVATCWKRWDVLEAPCQVPRERLLDYNLHGSHGAGGAEEGGVDTQTLGQFLQTHCFNLRRQCTNLKCKGSVLEHEQCFSHHGGRLSVRVQRLPPELLDDCMLIASLIRCACFGCHPSSSMIAC